MKCPFCMSEGNSEPIGNNSYHCPNCKGWFKVETKEEYIKTKKEVTKKLSTKEELKLIQSIVEETMSMDERSRNDDKWLIYKVVSRFTKIYIPFEDFSKFPSFETISRCRRKIQNDDKKYPPTLQEVIDRRKTRQKEFKENFSGVASD